MFNTGNTIYSQFMKSMQKAGKTGIRKDLSNSMMAGLVGLFLVCRC